MGNSTYCYTISAIYTYFQSFQSESGCITTENSNILGDINSDLQIDVLDVVILVNMILNVVDTDLSASDLNDDGQLNVLDVVTIVNIILDE